MKVQAFCQLRCINYQISIFVSLHQETLSPAESAFLIESIHKYPDNIAQFRMSIKAHKTPWKMRPIVCCSRTAINNLS